MGLGSSKPDSTPSTPPTAPSTRSGGAKLDKLPEALQGMVLGNLGLDCHLAVKKSSVALATTAVPFASSNSYGLSSRVMRARVRPLMRLRAYLESKSVALKSKSPVKKKTVMKPGAQPGNKNARRVWSAAATGPATGPPAVEAPLPEEEDPDRALARDPAAFRKRKRDATGHFAARKKAGGRVPKQAVPNEHEWAEFRAKRDGATLHDRWTYTSTRVDWATRKSRGGRGGYF